MSNPPHRGEGKRMEEKFNKLIYLVMNIVVQQGTREFSGYQWAKEMIEELNKLKFSSPPPSKEEV